ncbi:MAG: 6-bladed beta-propeller [Acidobacteria bacterium]|nr:MAG: 6-bladed beta-propeller [Acidobacteriota bacterium]
MTLRLFHSDVTLSKPTLVAMNSNNVYVFDDLTNRLFIFSLSGKLMRIVGRTGPGPGEFFHPIAMTASDNFVAIYDKGNQRVEFFSARGRFQSQFSLSADTRTLTVDQQKRIYINDPHNGNLITVYDEEGHVIGGFGKLTTVSALYSSKDRYRDDELHWQANRVWLMADDKGNVYASYVIAPVICKFSTSGHLLFERQLKGRLADSLRHIFWNARPGTRLLSSPMDGEQVDFVTRGVLFDRVIHRSYVLVGLDALFEIDGSDGERAELPIEGKKGGQFVDSAINNGNVFLTTTFQPDIYEGRIY